MASQNGNERSLVRQKCAALQWFHAIDFGDFSSSGRFPKGEPQNVTLLGAMEFLSAINWKGATALDVGTADGLAAFGIKALGAKRVVAIDSYEKETFRLAKDILGLDVEYYPRCQINDALEKFGFKSFDVILCAGVIYHMLNPMSAFTECRKLIKDGGFVIFESPITERFYEPVLALNSEFDDLMKEPSTYWVPTKSAMVGMMKLASFNVVAIRILKKPKRLTVLGQAVDPDNVKNRKQILEQIHKLDFCDHSFQLKEMKRHNGKSDVKIQSIAPSRKIDCKREQVHFPYHPTREKIGVGRTAWLTEAGNWPLRK